MKGATWAVFTTAKWIRNVLMKYPGILYDEIHAATFLGIQLIHSRGVMFRNS